MYRTRIHRCLPLGLSFAIVALSPAAAWAHPGVGPATGLFHGFAHPILGWDHVLAMVAVGLWAAQRGGRAVWAIPAAFVVTMAAGGALGAAGIPLPGVEAGILASVLVLGTLIAAAARLPVGVCAAVAALFALFHGHAHGAEMPASVQGLAYGLGFCTATTFLHATGALLFVSMRRALGARQLQWVRFGGAAIALGGLLLWLG
ncbi:MAG TPA: HupE/UreJ family protein [Longimicrobiales bacterium]